MRRGVGFAVGFKNIAYSEGFDDYCAARVRLLDDGSAEVHCAAAEVGQGVTGVILQVARTELGLDDVRLAPGQTATVDSAGSASASRMTWMAAGAVRDACRAALEEQARRPGEEIDVERIYRHPRTTPLDPETGQITGERSHVAFATCAMKVVAEVDVDLGLTRVVWIGAAQDVGKAVNPQQVEGQIEGGTAQGLGLALDGGDPDPRRPDHERELHRLPDPDGARHAAGRVGADRGSGARRALRRQGRRRAADRRLDGGDRLGPPCRDRAAARRACRSARTTSPFRATQARARSADTSDVATVGGDRERWTARPWRARLLRVLVYAVPIAGSLVFVQRATRLTGTPTSSLAVFLLWWFGMSVAATGAVSAAYILSRRLLPLGALLELSLVFPDEAPSSFRLALGSGTVEELQGRLSARCASRRRRRPTPRRRRDLCCNWSRALDVHDKGDARSCRTRSRLRSCSLGKQTRAVARRPRSPQLGGAPA